MVIVEYWGYFQKIAYSNGDYSVAIFSDAITGKSFKVCGIGIPVAKKIKYHFFGEMQVYKKTGEESLKMVDYEIAELDDESSFVEYLAMPPIKLSRVQGKKIYKLFRDKSVEILDNNPEQVYNAVFRSLKNGDERYQRFIQEWQRQRKLLKITSFLVRYGISRKNVTKLNDAVPLGKYDDLGAVIRDNPYFMMNVPGVHIDINVCDEIAKRLHYPLNSPERIKAAMKYALRNAMMNGNMFLYCFGKEGLIEEVSKHFSLRGEEVAAVLNTKPDGFVIEQDKTLKDYRVYLDYAHEWEMGLAKRIHLYLNKRPAKVMNEKGVEKFLFEYQKAKGITLAEKQKEAVFAVAESPITIITGGAGTGKTTSLNAVLAMLDAAGKTDSCLLASTGKASQRLSEATGRWATTIHSCIACDDSSEEGAAFGKNIECDALVIDEFSMTDCKVAYLLFSAIKSCKRIIIVGDIEQLPSVGAGNVLKDLINSRRIRVVALDVIQRQALDSPIVANAQKVLRGECDFIFNDNFRMTKTKNGAEAGKYIVERYLELVKEHGMKDVQILSPMKKRDCGTIQLNEAIQNYMFPSLKNDKFRIGDKVMNTKNNHDIGLSNGDMGYITNIVDDEYTIEFDTGLQMKFSKMEMDQIVLAYSVTVHKSQGTEVPHVIMPILNEHGIMLYRNLLYTGITRAKVDIELVGSEEMLKKAVETVKVVQRNTMLAKRLQFAAAVFDKKKIS